MINLRSSLTFVVTSGFFLGTFLGMVHIYSESRGINEFFKFESLYFILLGISIVFIFWLIYSSIISKITNSNIKVVLETDAKTYLPLVFLFIYLFQFTTPMENAVNAFSSIYSEFAKKIHLLPAKLILLLVLNLIFFLKIQAINIDISKLSSRIKIKSSAILSIFIATYALIFSYITVSTYRNYHSNYDLAIYNQAIWSTTKGHILLTSLEGGLHQGIDVASHFTNHFSPIYFLVTPIYYVFPFAETLLVTQSILLGLGALPTYLIGRKYLGQAGGLVFALIYLLYPSVNYINTFDFHEAAFTVPFLLFSFYYFIEKNFKRFLIFSVLALACKENIAPIIFMFGAYAIYSRRSIKWVIVPSALGFLWFVVTLYYVIPYFRAGDTYAFIGVYYSNFGSTPAEMIKTIIFNPLFTIKQVINFEKLVYILLIFLPVSFLSILNIPTLLIAAPTFLQNLLGTSRPLYSINFQYMQGIIPFTIASAVIGTRRIIDSEYSDKVITYVNRKLKFTNKPENKRFSILAFVLVNAIIMNVLYSPSPIGTFYNQADHSFDVDKKKSVQAAMNLIPDDARVSSQVWYASHLSKREFLFDFSNATNEKVNYILIDGERIMPSQTENFKHIIDKTGSEWNMIFNENDIMVFKRLNQ